MVGIALLAGCSPVTPQQARTLLQSKSADARREGVAQMSTRFDFGRRPPYTTTYQSLARTDPDVTVRSMAIRALNISRDATATPIFVAGLDDPEASIRLESAKALANVPDPAAVAGLIRHVTRYDDNSFRTTPAAETTDGQDVRIAAADALRHYRRLDAAGALAGLITDADFGVAYQARQSLVLLTGRDYQYDRGAWLSYLVGPDKPF